jgi:hypothetical protein
MTAKRDLRYDVQVKRAPDLGWTTVCRDLHSLSEARTHYGLIVRPHARRIVRVERVVVEREEDKA